MSRRPAINLADITSEAATPMPEAVQRAPRPAAVPAAAPPLPEPPAPPRAQAAEARKAPAGEVRTADLQPLAFKVPPAFRKRFRQHAANADLKLNELLFEALDAWEEKRGIKR